MIRIKALFIILILIGHVAYGVAAFASQSYFLHIQAKNQSSWQPMHWAVVYGVDWGDDSTVQMLLDKGADIEAKDSLGMTPLQLAFANDKLEIAKLLIKNKADIEAKDDNGNIRKQSELLYYLSSSSLGVGMSYFSLNLSILSFSG